MFVIFCFDFFKFLTNLVCSFWLKGIARTRRLWADPRGAGDGAACCPSRCSSCSHEAAASVLRAPAADTARRAAGPLESRADRSGEVLPTSLLGVPLVSRTDGSGEALTASQLGVRQDTRAAGSARRGLASRRMLIPENSHGCGLSLLLLQHFGGARTVIVQDGYVRTQLERLRELAEMARGSGVRRIEVVAKPWRPGELADVAADATSSDPLLSLVESVGGIEWSVRK